MNLNKLSIILQYYVLTRKNSMLILSFLLFVDNEWYKIKFLNVLRKVDVLNDINSGFYVIMYETYLGTCTAILIFAEPT